MSVVAAAPASGAPTPTLVALWEMNDQVAAGQSREDAMKDSSGNNLHGDVGSAVVLREPVATGNYAYRFKGDFATVDDERLVTIPDAQTGGRLDPGTGTFAISLRFKTGAADPNILQKGQAGQAGGYWKVVLKEGWPRCHFRDENGRTLAIGFVDDTRTQAKVNTKTWRTLRCERTATAVKATIDFDTPTPITKVLKRTAGNIDNTQPLSIGGKFHCEGVLVTCDYYAGAIDWIKIERP